MPEESETYLLQMLFDKDQISADELTNEAGKLLGQYQVTLKTTSDASGSPILSITGTLARVDESHGKLAKHLIGTRKLSFVRLVDEAGTEVRARAYAILARLEQRLRAFVDHAGAAVLGFTAWRAYVGLALKDKAQIIAEYTDVDGMCVSPLECCQFDDLIELVSGQVSDWSQQRSLSVADLNNLLESSSSFEEFRSALQKKMKQDSLWDLVFTKYVPDPNEWTDRKADLRFVVRERHKVMHHRPVRLGMLEALEKKERTLTEFLDRVSEKLATRTPTQIQEDVQKASAAVAEAARFRIREIWLGVPDYQKIFFQSPEFQEVLASMQEASSRALDQSAEMMSKAFKAYDWTVPMQEMQAVWGAIGEQNARTLRQLGEIIAAMKLSIDLTGFETLPMADEASPSLQGRRAPATPDFQAQLSKLLGDAQHGGLTYVDVKAGDLHRQVGGYPGKDHRMSTCCRVMRQYMKAGDVILNAPPKGSGATLEIRYKIPR